MIRAGELDRLIDIQTATLVRQPSGQRVPTWAPAHEDVPAGKRDATRTEVFRAGGKMSEATVAFRVRWIEGLSDQNRVVYEGEEYDVLGVLEVGRREGQDLMCRRQGAIT